MSSAVITSNGKSFRFEHLDLRTASIIASLEGICVICSEARECYAVTVLRNFWNFGVAKTNNDNEDVMLFVCCLA